jgi:RNA polymerase sporulation-specific sigma factor
MKLRVKSIENIFAGFADFQEIWEKIRLKLLEDNDIYYVNGPETLPAPLSAEEEADIISRLETNPSLKTILIERNLRLVVYIAKRFENSCAGIEDLVSIGTIGLMKAINTFKPDKNIKLATYASRCIENEILMYIRKNVNIKNEISIDEPLNVDWDGNELLLSDILGSDSDVVHRNIEESEDRRMIVAAIARLSCAYPRFPRYSCEPNPRQSLKYQIIKARCRPSPHSAAHL